MHFVPKWSPTYLQYYIVLSFAEYSGVDRVEVLLLWLYDKLLFYKALFITLIFFGIVMKGAVIFSKKMFQWRIIKSFFNGNSVRQPL